jgi:hypothetical protein
VRRHKTYPGLTLLISILFGILLPLGLGVKDLVYIAISITLDWVAYSIILFGYVFLVEGRRNRRRLMLRKEEEPFPYKVKGINGQRN